MIYIFRYENIWMSHSKSQAVDVESGKSRQELQTVCACASGVIKLRSCRETKQISILKLNLQAKIFII